MCARRLETRLGELDGNISLDKSSLTPQALIGYFLWDASSVHHSCYENILLSSAGRSLGFSVSMFVSDICNQTSNIADYGVEVLKRQIKH